MNSSVVEVVGTAIRGGELVSLCLLLFSAF